MQRTVRDLIEKAKAGERLSDAETLRLFEEGDLPELGEGAHAIRRRLHHAVEVPDIRRVALDRNSRTSNMLTRIILEKRYGVRPAYVTRDPSKGKISFKAVDAAVTIGDTSFRPAGVPFLDLGTEWKAFTGRPFVYALWAHRPGHPKAAEIAATLREAKKRGTARIPAIARREAKRLGLTPRFCRTYLTEYITFDLGPAERAGLRLFEKYAEECR